MKTASTPTAIAIALSLALGACGSAPQSTATTTSANKAPSAAPAVEAAKAPAALTLQQVQAGAWRSDADKARDAFRHPLETLTFFKVEPNMSVIEITPGGGWYAALLAPWLAERGRYIAAVQGSDDPQSYAAKSNAKLAAVFAAHPEAYANAQTIAFDPKAPSFGADASVDRVLTFRNVHNWAMGGYAEAMFQGFFAVLKPGGVLGVCDHRATEDEAFEQVKDSGYLPTEYVIQLATAAGFVLEARSEINANPKDDHHHDKGVWTLPPTLAMGELDREKYLAIGESDRMTLRFVKPDKAPAPAN